VHVKDVLVAAILERAFNTQSDREQLGRAAAPPDQLQTTRETLAGSSARQRDCWMPREIEQLRQPKRERTHELLMCANEDG
jgi:hypothetical protein